MQIQIKSLDLHYQSNDAEVKTPRTMQTIATPVEFLKLKIETQDKATGNEIEYAYNLALDFSRNTKELVEALKGMLGSYRIGRAGSHIWISTQEGYRQAIITGTAL